MIPRIIHYCWFSGDPFPPEVKQCIDSWHAYLPDYRFELWDYDRIRNIDSIWLKECLEERKWAFAADFIRVYAVYHHGGIYLDTDVLLFRSLTPLLHNSCFIGREWSWKTGTKYYNYQGLTSHCFGAEANHPFMARCLQYYENRHFIHSSLTSLPSDLRLSQTLMPIIQCELAKKWGYDPSLRMDGRIDHLTGMTVYPSTSFDPYTVGPETFCRHLCLGGWHKKDENLSHVTLAYRFKYHFDKLLKRLMWHLGYVISRK